MNNQIKVPIGENSKTVFLQSGFYHTSYLTSLVHEHCYAEMHIISEAGVSIVVDGKKHSISENSVFIIPKSVPHHWSHIGSGLRHAAFQIDDNIKDFKIIKIPPELSKLLFDEIDNVSKSNNHNIITGYLSVILALFFPDEACSLSKITDYELIINDFFSYKYSENATLSDLADNLFLSEKQTERLVIKYTGKTFKKALIEKRMNIAEYLSKTTALKMTEIAEHVGYTSYSGFWKAYNNHIKSKKDISI